MFNQHAKWLKVSRKIAWRAPIASLNILLTSHVWRQDHNGLSHQGNRPAKSSCRGESGYGWFETGVYVGGAQAGRQR